MLTDVLLFSSVAPGRCQKRITRFKQVLNHCKFKEGANSFEVKLPMQFPENYSLQIHYPTLLNKHTAVGILFTAK
jgi:hypothetical protein